MISAFSFAAELSVFSAHISVNKLWILKFNFETFKNWRMDLILSNPGFHHLGLQIFGTLDFKTLWRCRAVSPIWRNFIDSAFSQTVDKWRRFQIKGDFIIYQTEQNVTSMDYYPLLAEHLQDLASTRRISTFDYILYVGILCVEKYGNIKEFLAVIRIAGEHAERELEQMKRGK